MRSLRGLGLLLALVALASGGCTKTTPTETGGSGGSGGIGSGGSGGAGGGMDACGGTCTDGKVCNTDTAACVCGCTLAQSQGGTPCRPGTFCQDDCSCGFVPGQIGQACDSASDCGGSGQGASCLQNSQQVEFPGGYCSRPCGSAQPCPGGATCTTFGCVAGCGDDTDCRDGYTCTSVTATADDCGNSTGGQKVCFPKRSYSTCTGADCGKVGAACKEDSDCLAGGICLTGGGWADGYCSKLVFQTIGVDPQCSTADCGTGAGCALSSQATDPHNSCLVGQNTFLCLDGCDATKPGDCRDGYHCAANLNLTATTCKTDEDCSDRPGMSCTLVIDVGRLCTQHCDPGKADACPSGYFCGNIGLDPGAICMAMCKTGADCNQDAGETCSNYGLGTFDHQPTFACTKDADCAGGVPGATCSKSTLAGSCSLSQPCPTGFSCQAGICQSTNGICIPECTSDADCKLTDIPGDTRTSQCLNGNCLFQVCRGPANSGSCVPYDCSDDSNCRAGCTSDAMCASGKCDLETGQCKVKACDGSGSDAISATRKSCGVTSNCGVGQVPDPDGICQTPCQKADDCGQGFTCDTGFCKVVPGVCNIGLGSCASPCSSDGECSHGFHCDASTHCSLNCTSNDQCPFGACNEETGHCTQPCPLDGCGLSGVCTDGVCYQSCIGDGARQCPADCYCDSSGDATAGACLLRCDAPTAAACPGTEVCDAGSGQCVDRCPGRPCTTGVCNETSGLCVECVVPADCTAGGTTCDAAHKCAKTCTPPDASGCGSSQACCGAGADAGTCQDSCP